MKQESLSNRFFWSRGGAFWIKTKLSILKKSSGGLPKSQNLKAFNHLRTIAPPSDDRKEIEIFKKMVITWFLVELQEIPTP